MGLATKPVTLFGFEGTILFYLGDCKTICTLAMREYQTEQGTYRLYGHIPAANCKYKRSNRTRSSTKWSNDRYNISKGRKVLYSLSLPETLVIALSRRRADDLNPGEPSHNPIIVCDHYLRRRRGVGDRTAEFGGFLACGAHCVPRQKHLPER